MTHDHALIHNEDIRPTHGVSTHQLTTYNFNNILYFNMDFELLFKT